MNMLEGFQNWVETYVLSAPEMAAFGFAAAIGLAVVFLVLLARALLIGWRKARSLIQARSVKRDRSAGYRIMLAAPVGRGSRKARKFLTEAIETEFESFSFGAPYKVIQTAAIRGGRTRLAEKAARKRLAAADADMIVWAERISADKDGLTICSLSRGGGLRADEAKAADFGVPGKASEWNEGLQGLIAYKLAWQLQPALENPESFRGEKVSALAGALDGILAHEIDLPLRLQTQLENDFCACAVHAAEEGGAEDWLSRVIDLRRASLADQSFANNPASAIQARIDLGRALLTKASQQFDQAILQEAIDHLSAVVTVLQDEPTILRARRASEAMYKAQSMIENRKRFALNFGS